MRRRKLTKCLALTVTMFFLLTSFFSGTVFGASTGKYIRGAVDIIICIDNSGSMGDNIKEVKNHTKWFAKELNARGFDYRLGLVTFGHTSGSTAPKWYGSFVEDVQTFKNWLSGISLNGGYEPTTWAMDLAKDKFISESRPVAGRMLILVTDEDIQTHNGPKINGDGSIAKALEDEKILPFLVNDDKAGSNKINAHAKGQYYKLSLSRKHYYKDDAGKNASTMCGVRPAYEDILSMIGFNTAPEITAFSVTPTEILVSETVNCSASAKDEDGDEIKYTWTAVKPNGEVVDFSTNNTASLTIDRSGTWKIRLTVTDIMGEWAVREQDVLVKVGDARIEANPDNANNLVKVSWKMEPELLTSLFDYTVYQKESIDDNAAYTVIANSGLNVESGSACDNTPPQAISSIIPSQAGTQLKLEFTKPNDVGNTYNFYAHAVRTGEEPIDSNVATSQVITGTKQYIYSIDTNPVATPSTVMLSASNSDDGITESIDFTLPFSTADTYYLHIKSIDGGENATIQQDILINVTPTFMIDAGQLTDRVTAANNWISEDPEEIEKYNKYTPDSEVLSKIEFNCGDVDVEKYEIIFNANAGNANATSIKNEKISISNLDVAKVIFGTTEQAIAEPSISGSQISYSLNNPGAENITIYFKYNFKKGSTDELSSENKILKNSVTIRAEKEGNTIEEIEVNPIYIRDAKIILQ